MPCPLSAFFQPTTNVCEASVRKSWEDMTYHEKLENMRQDLLQLRADLYGLRSELEKEWEAMHDIRSVIGIVDKEVGTIRALSPHLAPRKIPRLVQANSSR
jgi:hypothetical protein